MVSQWAQRQQCPCANIFMAEIETNLIQQHNTNPREWKGYIDDVFSLWDCKRNEVDRFIEQANTFHLTTKFGSCVLKASVDRVSVDTIGRYADRQSADISTYTRPICRPRLGRHIDRRQRTCMSADTSPPLGRQLAGTLPTLGGSCASISTEYRSILSVGMSTDSRPISRPILGRYVGRDSADISTDINRHACQLTPGRYFTATWPTPGQHYAQLVGV